MENKRHIKINFVGCNNEIRPKNNLILHILNKHFDVEISPDPDFVICGMGGNHFEYMKYDCVRIMLMTENLSPDFTLFDYFIGFDYLSFGDRYFRLPYGFQNRKGEPWIPTEISEETALQLYQEKEVFCNFIYRHPSSHGIREKIFDTLEAYKPITSAGNYRNNVLGQAKNYSNEKGRMLIETDQKLEYLKKSKFTIAVESVLYPGFETEKIVHAFQMHSIPIYYGADTISNTYNDRAYINASVMDLKELSERVQYIDTHKDRYIEMLMECPLKDRLLVKSMYEKLEQFIVNIFDQDPSQACRRPKHYYVDSVEASLKQLSVQSHSPFRKTCKRIKRKISNILK